MAATIGDHFDVSMLLLRSAGTATAQLRCRDGFIAPEVC